MRRLGTLVLALAAGGAVPGAAQTQTAVDEYTRYELLDPASAQFKIRYDVTAATPGARYFFNPIRKGSVATDESVFDRATGQPLAFEVVPGSAARVQGFGAADLETDYIRVTLPRAVPINGEVRILIVKTYRDPKSYYAAGDTIVFARSLGIKMNAVVLPAGYELVGLNVPSQVLTEPDGRTLISFINAGPDAASLVVTGRRLAR
ncbi:MAG: hypothetical protein EXR94_09300 [Gemmatimonadetes bacterium]|nr:hypothetical protein [Gemmatimonadota bacterium]